MWSCCCGFLLKLSVKEGNDFQITQLTAPALALSVFLDGSYVTRAACSEITLSGRVTRGREHGCSTAGVVQAKVQDAAQMLAAAD